MYRDQTFGTKTSEVIDDMGMSDLSSVSLKQYREYMQIANPTLNYNKLSTEEFLSKVSVLVEVDFSIGTFYLPNSQNARVNASLNQLQGSILKEITLNSKVSYDELADKFDKNRTTIVRNIQKLKALGLIERIGSDKTGHWRVK